MNPEPPVTSTREPCSAVICSPFAVATSQLCLTRFYRDPPGDVAWSGEATRYEPATTSPVCALGVTRPGTCDGYPGIIEHRSSRCPALAAGLWLPRSALRPKAGTARRLVSVAAGCQCFPCEAAADSNSGLLSMRRPGGYSGRANRGSTSGPGGPSFSHPHGYSAQSVHNDHSR